MTIEEFPPVQSYPISQMALDTCESLFKFEFPGRTRPILVSFADLKLALRQVFAQVTFIVISQGLECVKMLGRKIIEARSSPSL